MSAPSLKELCLEQVVASADRFLSLQWSDGRFEVVPEHETDEWNFFQQQYTLPAALLYTLDHPGNPWRGDERLWKAILRHGRHIESRIAADGSMAWRLGGVVLGSPFVCQRLTCAWLMAYQLLRDHLPTEEKQRWRAALLRACEWLVRRHLLPHREAPRFTSHDVGTGTNHFSLYLSLIYLAGVEFGRPDWAQLASDLMRRLIADQRPGGYWEEHHGPALAYDYLTCHGVDQYTAWSGDEAGLAALRRGLDLHRHWTYPDSAPIECVDGRVRHLSGPWPWGLAGFTRWPDGRGYARLLIESLLDKELSGEFAARLADAYLMLHEGAEQPPPQTRARYRATLDGASVVRKQGPWVTALSGQCSPRWPENQFFLDRQALASIWREGVGLVLDGSNSKGQPELATFCRRRGGEADHLPLEATLLTAGDDATEAIEVRYSNFAARLRLDIVNPNLLTLSAAASRPSDAGVMLTLVPHVSFGESFTFGGNGKMTLGEEPFKLTVGEGGAPFSFRGVRMSLPAGAQVEYPVGPFNSYSADNTSPPTANRLVVRCIVGAEEVTFRLEVA